MNPRSVRPEVSKDGMGHLRKSARLEAATSRSLRTNLVRLALAWQGRFGVAPAITSAVSEYDAARLVGMLPSQYGRFMRTRSAVSKGYDFAFAGVRYQVKSNRPSGRNGAKVSKVGKPSVHEWDKLIWILYDERYRMREAWKWTRREFDQTLGSKEHLRPDDLRRGTRLK